MPPLQFAVRTLSDRMEVFMAKLNKQQRTLLNQRKKELLSAAVLENPELAKGKKLCGVLALLWVITRAIHLLIELFMAFSIEGFIISPTNITVMFIVVLFSFSIYSGIKGFVILPIIGGAIMTLQIFTSQVYFMLGAEYIPIARLYALAFIVASLYQLVFPVILLNAGPSKLYFDTAQMLTKEAEEQIRQGQ